LALARDLSSRTGTDALYRRCRLIREALVRDGLYEQAPTDAIPRDGGNVPAITTRWRIAPHPFPLTQEQVAFLRSLGTHLLTFYRILNRLYLDSVRGAQPAWVAAYLDQGKPESLITYSRMKRFREQLPAVIRPDIIPTDDGMIITELDSVPGGIGLTGALARAYSDEPEGIVGGTDGIMQGFAAMVQAQKKDRPGGLAIVVSDEARDYRPEMMWLAAQLRDRGLETRCVAPSDIHFTEEALLVSDGTGDRPVAVLYRFFELFDLMNVPKSELIMYSAKKDRVAVTPPFKPQLEEKLAFALLHHPVLRPFWKKELGEETYGLLTNLMPRTWILDPRPLPPQAIIPDLSLAGRAVADWHELAGATQKERRFVVKPSGFSELAWGSRGVSVGHDLPQSDWAAALEHALASFPTTPYILQEFHKGRQFDLSYHDEHTDEIVPMSGRARLSPYYFVVGERAELGGVLATVCPPDKKLIHGMRDAVMVPCSQAAANAVR
jgi:hypothetical protein